MTDPIDGHTIAELESRITRLKTKKTKTAVQEIENLKRAIRNLQEKYKAVAYELEKTNFSQLIFVDSTNNFQKLTGNSALFYVNDIANRIGRRANLIIDTDRYSRSRTGVVSVKLSLGLIENLANISVTKSIDQKYAGLTVFNLPTPYSQNEIETMYSDQEKISEQINKLIMPKTLIPAIFSDLRELNIVIFQNTQNMNPFGRKVIGTNLLSTCDKMMLRYCELTNGDLKIEDGLLRIIKGAKYLKYELKNVENLRLMNNKTIMRALELLIRIENESKKEYKMQKAKVDDLIKGAIAKEKSEPKF